MRFIQYKHCIQILLYNSLMKTCERIIEQYNQNLFLDADKCNWLAVHLDNDSPCCNADKKLHSMTFLRMAATLNHEIAQVSLGFILKESDNIAAYNWFLKAAEQGNAQAQYEVGLHLEKTSFTEAIKWISKSAANGDKEAVEYLKKGTFC